MIVVNRHVPVSGTYPRGGGGRGFARVDQTLLDPSDATLDNPSQYSRCPVPNSREPKPVLKVPSSAPELERTPSQYVCHYHLVSGTSGDGCE